MDETFDLENWLEQTRQIPHAHIAECLKAVSARYTAIQDEPKLFAQRNETARTYHASVTHDLVGGVPVWSAPIAVFAGWPSHERVHHAGVVWLNIGADVAMGEPGVDPVWMQEELESPVGDDEIVEEN